MRSDILFLVLSLLVTNTEIFLQAFSEKGVNDWVLKFPLDFENISKDAQIRDAAPEFHFDKVLDLLPTRRVDTVLIEEFFWKKVQGIAVELGGGDGTPNTHSMTYTLEKFFRWKRVVVDGAPIYKDNLNISAPKAFTVSAAICDNKQKVHYLESKEKASQAGIFEYMSPLHLQQFYPSLYNNTISTINSSSTFDWSLAHTAPDLGISIFSITELSCLSLSTVLERLGVKHVNFLKLDVAGAEYSVLHTIDWSIYTFDVICVSIDNSHQHRRKYLEIIRLYLKQYGYILAVRQQNPYTWFKHVEFRPSSRNGHHNHTYDGHHHDHTHDVHRHNHTYDGHHHNHSHSLWMHNSEVDDIVLKRNISSLSLSSSDRTITDSQAEGRIIPSSSSNRTIVGSNTAEITTTMSINVNSSSQLCTCCLQACGNALVNQEMTISTLPSRSLRFNVMTVWIHNQIYFRDIFLNHFKYAMEMGYQHKYFFHSKLDWMELSGNLPAGWGKVWHLLELLNTDVDYIVYADMDTVFMRNDIRIEQFISTRNSYSLYAQEIHADKFVQSHFFILKNSNFSKEFVERWWELRLLCPNICMEQGAYFFTIAEYFHREFPSSTPFPCVENCSFIEDDGNKRNIANNNCYNNWMTLNGFGFNTTNVHPHIFIYPWNSRPSRPEHGFTVQAAFWEGGAPFTVHPCKNNGTHCHFRDPSSVSISPAEFHLLDNDGHRIFLKDFQTNA